MAIPFVIIGAIKVAAIAITAYEAYTIGRDVLQGVDQFGYDLEEAKRRLEEYLKDLEDEIGDNIDKRAEVSALRALSEADPQRPATRHSSGRGSGSSEVDAAIEQEIPFRKVISKVCDEADRLPILNVRKKRGSPRIQPSRLLRLKREAVEYMLETGSQVLPARYQSFVEVLQLKQLAADFLFEFIDHLLDWKSPLKCEVCFSPPSAFDDPKLDGGTKLQRSNSRFNPFFPPPYRKRAGQSSITADLVIPDYRKDPVAKDNLFAIVEIKFSNDRPDVDQITRYRQLLEKSAITKTQNGVGVYNHTVRLGGRLALFRYPEDRARGLEENSSSPSRSRTNRKSSL